MTAKIKPKDIPVKEMKQGQIGIITQWGNRSIHIGTLVTLNDDRLTAIGTLDDYWSNYSQLDDDCRVAILGPGDTITI